MTIRALRHVICVLAATLACGSGLAQEYPAKTVRMIVPFPPGGGTDLIARITSAKLSQVFWPAVRDRQPTGRRNRDRFGACSTRAR